MTTQKSTGVVDDEALMLRVRAGDKSAMSDLFARHHRSLFSIARRLIGDDAAAEDIVQESFLKMLRYRHSFREDSRFKPWAYQVLRNCCTDLGVAHSRRMEQVLERESPEHALVVDEQAVEIDQVAASRQELALLKSALDSLPIDRREVIVLARLQGRSTAEVSSLLGCSPGAARVRLHRAVEELRSVFEQRLRAVRPAPQAEGAKT